MKTMMHFIQNEILTKNLERTLPKTPVVSLPKYSTNITDTSSFVKLKY